MTAVLLSLVEPDMENFPIRLSPRVVYSRKHSQRDQSQMVQIKPSPPMRASPLSAGWPLPLSCNEAEASSRDATARALTFPSFNGQDRPIRLRVG